MWASVTDESVTIGDKTRQVVIEVPAMSITSPFSDLYEPIDIIGNGSFGIIWKVRWKQDGVVSNPI